MVHSSHKLFGVVDHSMRVDVGFALDIEKMVFVYGWNAGMKDECCTVDVRILRAIWCYSVLVGRMSLIVVEVEVAIAVAVVIENGQCMTWRQLYSSCDPQRAPL